MKDLTDEMKMGAIRHSRARAAMADAAALEAARVYSQLCPEYESHPDLTSRRPRPTAAVTRVVELAKRMSA